jgi:hypothetical protein
MPLFKRESEKLTPYAAQLEFRDRLSALISAARSNRVPLDEIASLLEAQATAARHLRATMAR